MILISVDFPAPFSPTSVDLPGLQLERDVLKRWIPAKDF